MQKQKSSKHTPGLNLGVNPIGSYGSNEEIPLPLPSKNSTRGKKIISTLLREGEALTSKTQFNFRPTENDPAVGRKQSSLHRAPTVVKYEARNLSSVNKGEFESKLLGSPNVGSADPMNCAALFDKQYLLLGNDTGLFVMDFSVRWEIMKPKQLLRGCPFKKLQILDDYGVMIAIAGKRQTMRVYKLKSLMHLIKFVINSKSGTPIDFSKVPPFLRKVTDSLPKCEICGRYLDKVRGGDRKNDNVICSNCKYTQDGSDSNTDESNVSQSSSSASSGKFHRRQLSSISLHISDFIQQHLSNSIDDIDIGADERINVWTWATDYIKLTEAAKGCVAFDIKETKSYVYLTVVTINHSILLFSCSTESMYKADCKFEYLDSYFVPTTPSFISVFTDSFTIKQIIAGMDQRAVVIDCYTSTVIELDMNKDLIPRDVDSPCWISFTPIPRSCSLDFLFDNPVKFESKKHIISLTPEVSQTSASQESSSSLKLPPTPLTVSNTLKRSLHSKVEKRRSRSQPSDVTSASSQPLQPPPTDESNQTTSEKNVPDDESRHASTISTPKLTIPPEIFASDESIDDLLEYITSPPPSPMKNASDDNFPKTHATSASQSTAETYLSGNLVDLVKATKDIFICTISKASHIVNMHAEPYPFSPPIHWKSEPNQISLLPTIDDIFVIAFQNQMIEVGSMKTGQIVKTVSSGSPVKYLGESWRKPIPLRGRYESKKEREKFDKGIKRYIFWSCELGDDTYIYRGGVL
ncbi:16281_t:CDS:2 [Acaulospora colombiana]|uniref:16281_t:CDS:1 n=1 Tax=Acaulospora colombiana TaxID=27376 RepID=A0ACA9KYH9_9GLOM|nr:16281_t:CDS:2 [Acaulospora colombiana]